MRYADIPSKIIKPIQEDICALRQRKIVIIINTKSCWSAGAEEEGSEEVYFKLALLECIFSFNLCKISNNYV